MITLADALKALVQENALLQFGLRHRLINLSRAAEFLRPHVTARVKKSVQPSAIVMALSRLQRSLGEKSRREKETSFKVENIFMNSDLSVMSFPNTAEVRRQLNAHYGATQKRGGYMTITQGVHQITTIVERNDEKKLRQLIHDKPLRANSRVASLGISFPLEYGESPGFFYFVFQQLYLQSINCVEIASTASELVIYLEEKDVRLAFDTIYNCFVSRNRL